jgi:hypothetical protein
VERPCGAGTPARCAFDPDESEKRIVIPRRAERKLAGKKTMFRPTRDLYRHEPAAPSTNSLVIPFQPR